MDQSNESNKYYYEVLKLLLYVMLGENCPNFTIDR